MTFPTNVPSLPRPTSSTLMDAAGFEGDTVIDGISDNLEAGLTKLGTGSSTPTTTGNALKVTGAGATAYGQVAASEVSNAPSVGIDATTVQSAIDELSATDIDLNQTILATADYLAEHLDINLQPVAHPAAQIGNTPSGTIAATTVQAAINELSGDDATHAALTGTSAHGLGTMSTQAASAVAITGGTINGTPIGPTVRAIVNATLFSQDEEIPTGPLDPDQAYATALDATKGIHKLGNTMVGGGYSLPVAVAGQTHRIIHTGSGGGAALIWGLGTTTINGVTNATGFTVNIGETVDFTCYTAGAAGTWFTSLPVLLPASRMPALTGDVTNTAGALATTIANNAVTLAKMATVATDKLLGRDTAGTGNVEALSVSGGLEFSGSTGIQRSALTGDVTATAGSNATTIANAAVTLAKMANLAQDQFIGRTTASTGVPETATITSAARTVLDDTTVGAMVDTLGGATSTGTGGIARASSPVFTTPNIGTATGSITGNAATVTTNANLTGPVTSTGNATAIADNAITAAMQTRANSTKTTTYAVTDSDFLIRCDTTSGAFTVTLPTAVGRGGKPFVIEKSTTAAGNLTIATTSSQNLNLNPTAATTLVIAVKGHRLHVISNGTDWDVLEEPPKRFRLAGSNTNIAHTGTTGRTNQVQYTIPANAVKVGGRLEITIYMDAGANNANAKTAIFQIGATDYKSGSLTSTLTNTVLCQVHLITTTTQTAQAGNTGYGTSGSASTAGAEDFSTALTGEIDFTLGNSGDTMNLRAWFVEVVNP